MSQSGRPLQRNVYNKNAYFSGNGIKTSSVSAETNTLTTAASETMKLKDSTRSLLDRLADGYDKHIQTEAHEIVTLWVVGGDERGSLKSEKDLAVERRQHIQKTDPSSRQRGHPRKQDRNCQRVINWGSTPRLTDWLTVSRNAILTLRTRERELGGEHSRSELAELAQLRGDSRQI
jgi:hypothetical protein